MSETPDQELAIAERTLDAARAELVNGDFGADDRSAVIDRYLDAFGALNAIRERLYWEARS